MDYLNKCYFCNGVVENSASSNEFLSESEIIIAYNCANCGAIRLSAGHNQHGSVFSAREIFEQRFTAEFPDENSRKLLGVILRNIVKELESKGQFEKSREPSIIENLISMYKSQKSKDSIELINDTLLILDKHSESVGAQIEFEDKDYYLFYCTNSSEMQYMFRLLKNAGFIDYNFPVNDKHAINIRYNGYNKLAELKIKGEGKQCFVAMWFNSEMDGAYEAIRSAIEYKEEGQDKSLYKAYIVNRDHHNDNINNKIIAEIRRSKFMVCDLTGYRGGVYFEAGFAYGLGLKVIYTCRKDWTKELVTIYYDKDKNPVEVKREGVHFDLAHTMRIEWEPDKLDQFKEALTQQIRATIV